jgi:hypothetical protein
MRHLRLLVPIVAATLAPALSCADYLGMVKVPRSLVQQPDRGIYSFSSSTQSPFLSGSGADSTHELKLGYKYSKFLSIEGQFNDFNRPQDPFSTRATIAPTFHGSGYGVDTVATLPVWRFSFYGKMGAYHGEAATPFSPYATSLVNGSHDTRLRYGLGMRFNLTRTLGLEAQMERYAPLGSPLAGEPESDLFSLGVKWRF